LDKIGLPVEIPIAFNLDHLVVFVGFDDIRPANKLALLGALLADANFSLSRMA
jgi:hypothetical protein